MKQLFTIVGKQRGWLAGALLGVLSGGASLAQGLVVPDATFGTSGSTSTALTGRGCTFSSTSTDTPTMTNEPGQLLVASSRIWVCGSSSSGFVVQRYLLDGTPDVTFGTGGTVATAFPAALPDFPGMAQAAGLALQPDGKLVVVGRWLGKVANSLAAARYNPNGTLDTTFGTNGLVTSTSGLVARQVVVLPSGNLLMSCSSGSGPSPTMGLIRLLPTGQYDTSFAPGNFLPYYVSYSGAFQRLVVQPDGKVLVLATDSPSTPPFSQVVVRRLTSTGNLDNSFGTAGQTTITGTEVSGGQTLACGTEAFGAVVQPDGKIVLAGRLHISHQGIGDRPALLRLHADGTPDTAFNTATNNVNTLPITGGALAIDLQPDGALVVGGSAQTSNPGSTNQVLLARYTAAGVPDATFHTTSSPAGMAAPVGYYTQTLPSGSGTITGLSLQPGGAILTLGGYVGTNNLRLARYQQSRVTATRSATTLFQLQAAPVPAAGPVLLRYTLPTPTAVRFALHDQLGRLVASPGPATPQAAGAQEFVLATDQLANGLYFCTLQTGTLSQTIRLSVAH